MFVAVEFMMTRLFFMKRILIFIVRFVIAILFIICIPYYYSCIYSFTESKSFSGDQFYNPYSNLDDEWLKANFHAHSKLAGGLAHGDNSPNEMLAEYDSIGYDLPCISNYNSIYNSERDLYVSDFEHGFNFGFVHQLVLNRNSSSWFDYPLFQSKHHKQFILNSLKEKDCIVALAHPNFQFGYNEDDVSMLLNYELMEVISRTASSVGRWDEALSSGHAVWAIGNDDSHEVDINSIGVCWTSINVNEKSAKSILKNLKRGRSIATRGWRGQDMQQLKFVNVEDGIMTVGFNKKADSIILKSDAGKTVAFATNDSIISYEIKPENSYVRTEVYETEPWNNYTRMYLNPILRSKTSEFISHTNKAEVSYFWTFLYWLGLFLFQWLLLFAFKRLKMKKIR